MYVKYTLWVVTLGEEDRCGRYLGISTRVGTAGAHKRRTTDEKDDAVEEKR
jgi:hypothetical protein